MLSTSLAHISVNAQNEVKRDSSNLTVRYFEDNLAERYDTSEFNYNLNDTGGVNLLQRIFQKIFGWISEIFGIDLTFIDYRTLELIIYGLLALGAVLLLIKFLLRTPSENVFKRNHEAMGNIDFTEENISEINLDELVDEAAKNGNYRLATRYLYLKALKLLAEKNIIEWHFEKTNSDYLKEISDSNIKRIFKRISYLYDYIWYGEFSIDKETYEKNKSVFQKLVESK